MTGRDLNSINDAFVKATVSGTTEEVEEPKELVAEDTENKEIINEMDPLSLAVGAGSGALLHKLATRKKKKGSSY